uniref:VWFD domain-containing protein n=1 Tax=Pavo cristatus TaxID=9049 RepID=A0A8C9FPX6_PAVCR
MDALIACGCVYEGLLYGPGEEFWGDDGCTKRCICMEENRKVMCHQASCRAKEECGVKDGIRGCYPTSYGVCTAVGSTHYKSFDGGWFTFQGTCLYQLVGLCKSSRGLVDFQVQFWIICVHIFDVLGPNFGHHPSPQSWWTSFGGR